VDIGYWLLVIGYWLLVIGYWLLVIGELILDLVPRIEWSRSDLAAVGYCSHNVAQLCLKWSAGDLARVEGDIVFVSQLVMANITSRYASLPHLTSLGKHLWFF
jgi:hypothetical protein